MPAILLLLFIHLRNQIPVKLISGGKSSVFRMSNGAGTDLIEAAHRVVITDLSLFYFFPSPSLAPLLRSALLLLPISSAII